MSKQTQIPVPTINLTVDIKKAILEICDNAMNQSYAHAFNNSNRYVYDNGYESLCMMKQNIQSIKAILNAVQ